MKLHGLKPFVNRAFDLTFAGREVQSVSVISRLYEECAVLFGELEDDVGSVVHDVLLEVGDEGDQYVCDLEIVRAVDSQSRSRLGSPSGDIFDFVDWYDQIFSCLDVPSFVGEGHY